MKNKKLQQLILIDEKIGIDGKYHYFYKITNFLNNKVYLGVHTTTDLSDGYAGSGKILKRAYDCHGVENFKKEILLFFGTEEEMYLYEGKEINEEIARDNHYYNVCSGGKGGRKGILVVKDKNGDILTISRNDERYIKGELISVNRGEGNPRYGVKLSEETRKIMSEKRKKYLSEHPIQKGRIMDEETKKKIGDNSRGRKRMIKDGCKKLVKPEDIQMYLNNGWELSADNNVYIHNTKIGKIIHKDKLQKFLNEGWMLCDKEKYLELKKDNKAIPKHLISGTAENIAFIEKCRVNNQGRVITEEQREKIRKTMIERGTTKGSNNPMYGIKRKNVTNGVINRLLNINDVESFLKENPEFYIGYTKK